MTARPDEESARRAAPGIALRGLFRARVIDGSGPAAADVAEPGPERPITVEEAYRARLTAARAVADDAATDSPDPAASGTGQAVEAAAPPLPTAEPCNPRPVIDGSGPSTAARAVPRPEPLIIGRPRPPVGIPRPGPPPPGPSRPPARPRIEPETGLLGLSRHARSRIGSRLFNLVFVFVFVLILVQMIVALLAP